MSFDINCRQCPRLAQFLDEVKQEYPEYHARPVEPFGVNKPKLLIVGLAPGLHGANATGRPFTGDYAGILLYETLHRFGLSNQSESVHLKDGLKLNDCRITNAVKCLPPENKPSGSEIKNCNHYLADEITSLQPKVILALGKIAHDAVLRATEHKLSAFKFQHAEWHQISATTRMIDSYHCSRYNTNTGRLTEKMFHDIFSNILEEI